MVYTYDGYFYLASDSIFIKTNTDQCSERLFVPNIL